MVRTKLEDLSVMEDMTRWLSKHKNIKQNQSYELIRGGQSCHCEIGMMKTQLC